jgi:N-acetylglucosamine-6-phosphate deacetylase
LERELNNPVLVKNGSTLVGGRLERADVLIENGLIAGVGSGLRAESTIDAEGGYVLPGLIDIHTHAIGRVSVWDGSLVEFARLEAEHGATTFFPTFFSGPDELASAMRAHREATDDLGLTPRIGGFRLESPYLARTGAGTAPDLVRIRPEVTKTLIEAGGGLIRIWDISPELDGACDAIAELSRTGIVCSIAHTAASIDQARAAVDAGARLVTHLFDVFGLPEVTEPGAYPAGLVDYLLTEDRLTCEIIPDGTHVHPLLVEKAFRCKPSDRLLFVTDGNLGSGLPPGEYTLPNWGRVTVNGPNEGVRLTDRGMELAGSALTPIDAFRNAIRLFGRDIAAAVRLCSTAPARLLGLNKGEIAPGRDGDLIVLDEALELRQTIAGGKPVWRAEG